MNLGGQEVGFVYLACWKDGAVVLGEYKDGTMGIWEWIGESLGFDRLERGEGQICLAVVAGDSVLAGEGEV